MAVQFNTGLALEGGGGVLMDHSDMRSGSAVGVAPVTLQWWEGGLFSENDLRLSISPEISGRGGWNNFKWFGRGRLDLGIGYAPQGWIKGDAYGVYDTDFQGASNWGVGIYSPLLNPLYWCGRVADDNYLSVLSYLLPAYAEWDQGISSNESRVTYGIRIQTDWETMRRIPAAYFSH